MRKLLPAALLTATLTLLAATAPAYAAGHQFRGHIDTTAILGPTITINGHGNVSGLGKTTFSGTEVDDPITGLTGQATFTAANGDQVSFAFTGVPVDGSAFPVIAFAGPMTLTGGTGHFAARAGTVQFTGGYNFATNVGFIDVNGSIGS